MKIVRARLKAYKGANIEEFISVRGRIKGLIENNKDRDFDFVIEEGKKRSIKSFGPNNIDEFLVDKKIPIIDNTYFAKFNNDGSIEVEVMSSEGALPRARTVNKLKEIRRKTKNTTIDNKIPKTKVGNEKNSIDSGIESYEDFEKKNKSFISSWNLKHLKSPFKKN